MIEQVQAMIFDADGMVILGERFSTRLAREYSIPMEDINLFFDTEFKECLVGKKDLKEALVPFLSKWGWRASVDELLRFWFAESYVVDTEMVRMIHVLRDAGIKCMLATNQEKYRVHYLKTAMGLETVFDDIIASYQVGEKKMSPTFFSVCADALPSIPHEKILFWDDREENIVAAKQFGFKTRLYTGIEDFRTFCAIDTEVVLPTPKKQKMWGVSESDVA